MQPDLIARIEKAQPSEARVVFWEAFRSAFPAPVGFIHDRKWTDLYGSFIIYMNAHAYLDAAAMFVPERVGHWPQVCTISTNPNNPSSQKDRVEIWMKNGGRPFRGHATTPAFALLAASLKARQTDADCG
jgi:hypothetical protein